MSGTAWIASYVLLWIAVLVLGLAVVVLLRHIGVLHARLGPQGVHHGNEGPTVGDPAPAAGWFDYAGAELTLVTFTAPGCPLCAELVPSLERLARVDRTVQLQLVDHGRDEVGVFAAWNVSQTPYVVAVDRDGIVRGGGIANSLEQVETLIDSIQGEQRDAA
ncbi:hypothetical protein ER308_05990 [Egibacter rhizosphaerae]|uniref:Thioredoxin domain-containing protein n=1 Tax=Egibacter rhizosphaerae TaxID=1670831 RepID=A0A411YD15_9ACTN|nr:hypothetical protein [Egibacter rhizosphaerae]QBI19133.1 hypothetical protein ER308_05990 [Egibacter rhizosphaerae]